MSNILCIVVSSSQYLVLVVVSVVPLANLAFFLNQGAQACAPEFFLKFCAPFFSLTQKCRREGQQNENFIYNCNKIYFQLFRIL